jgi:hypothetical protein
MRKHPTGGQIVSTADEITKLTALRDAGELTPEQFEAEKAKLLSPPHWSTLPLQFGHSAPALPLANPPPPPPPSMPVPVGTGKKRAAIGCLTALVVVVVAVAIIAGVASSGPRAKIVGHAYAVVPLTGNLVRVYMEFTNTGKASGTSSSCQLETNVYNEFGDNVNYEVNQTAPNGNLKPGQSQRIYQDIGVNNGDAAYTKLKGITITSC